MTFKELYEENYSYIYNYIYMQILHQQNTEDIVADVFMKAMTHFDGYVDFFRKSGRAETVDLENAPEVSVDDQYEFLRDPVNTEVKRILEKLSKEERAFLSLRYGQDMKNEQIGLLYGINAKAVSERYRRLLAKCRKLAGNININELLS